MSYFQFYQPLNNTNIDTMHSVFYGVIKGLFNYWFEIKCEASLIRKIDEIDQKLLTMKPTCSVPHAPRSIKHWKIWKAHEFLSFILYFSLPVFYEIMSPEYYSNLILLVISLENLFSRKIEKIKLVKIHQMIIMFVKQLESLYPLTILSSGIHELLHLCDYAMYFGPPNHSNCFPFEEFNHLFLQIVKGKDLIGDEFIKLFSTIQLLNNVIFNIEFRDQKLFEFVKKNFRNKTSNNKCEYNEKKILSFTEKILTTEENIILPKIIQDLNFVNIGDNPLKCFNKVKINRSCFKIISQKNKFEDSGVMSRLNGEFGIIEFIAEINSEIILICKKFVFLHSPFFDNEFPEIRSNYFLACSSNEYFSLKINDAQKIFYYESTKNLYFFSSTQIGHLFS